ncbi:outer membrane beta-barrel protein [Occallatibacter savannae]|uniref:outer membrane beta-barrel protein n=1 Tax=Occallatibacter savannae TaxID=1002691 RepID=UPI000D69B47E|nr:outer membrane beta-barrel protein [Occallatibacter savannae]
MVRKPVLIPTLFLILLGCAAHLGAQVTYSAREGRTPLSVGFGVADFSDDWGVQNPRQIGLTLWIDWRLPHMPRQLQGLGLDIEGRDVNYATPSYIAGHRMTTGLGGPMYQWRRDRLIRPYAKYLIGFGNIDFPGPPGSCCYQQDTRVIFAPAAGADVRLVGRLSARGEYEYQFWHQIFGPHDLNPNGFTFGVVYDLGRIQQ